MSHERELLTLRETVQRHERESLDLREQLARVERERDESLERECAVFAELDELRGAAEHDRRRAGDAAAALARARSELEALGLERDQSLERECATAAELDELRGEVERTRRRIAERTRETASVPAPASASAHADELTARLQAITEAVSAIAAETARARAMLQAGGVEPVTYEPPARPPRTP